MKSFDVLYTQSAYYENRLLPLMLFIFQTFHSNYCPPSLGTIRRFLEHYGDTIDLVVFVTNGEEV